MCIKSKLDVEEIKQECKARLKLLGLAENVIQGFKDDKLYVTTLPNNSTEEATTYEQVIKLVKSFEKNKKVKIYHMINIEEPNKIVVYLLYVKADKTEWEKEKTDLRNVFLEVYSYKETRTVKHIGIETNKGKIKRIC